MLSKQTLDELKNILAEEYGLELTDEEVAELGNTLVSCFQVLAESEKNNL